MDCLGCQQLIINYCQNNMYMVQSNPHIILNSWTIQKDPTRVSSCVISALQLFVFLPPDLQSAGAEASLLAALIVPIGSKRSAAWVGLLRRRLINLAKNITRQVRKVIRPRAWREVMLEKEAPFFNSVSFKFHY